MSNIAGCLIKIKKYDLWNDDEKVFNKNFLKWSLKNHPDKLSPNLSPEEKKSKSRLYQEMLDCRNMIIENFSITKMQNSSESNNYTSYTPSKSNFEWTEVFDNYNKMRGRHRYTPDYSSTYYGYNPHSNKPKSPTKPPSKPKSPTKPPSKPKSPTKPPSKPKSSSKPPSKPKSSSKPPSKPKSSSKPPKSPTKPPSKPKSPTKPPSKPKSPVKKGHYQIPEFEQLLKEYEVKPKPKKK
jgi:hypothetical protein